VHAARGLTFDLAPADIPLLNAFIAQRAAFLPANSAGVIIVFSYD
jgi:hypothetical protein